MKLTLAVLALCVAVATAMPLADTSSFESWMSFHGKEYNSDSEAILRRAVFESNKKLVLKHNEEYARGEHTYYLGLNEFADLSGEEFAQLYLSEHVPKRTGSTYLAPSHVEIPSEVDWRKEGYVTPVKNQGQCGSCWSFSTTGSLEGQHFKKTGKLVSLSEQNLVDCAGSYGNQGCNGGLMDNAFEYIKNNGGIDTEASYPYTAEDGSCHYSAAHVGATVSGHTDIPQGDVDALTKAAATVGPISVAIDASHFSFQMYSGGVYNEPSCSSSQLDHGVLVVGYGTDSGKDFFWVKNSWGASWGLSGYIKMTRDSSNQCGIATSASYPSV